MDEHSQFQRPLEERELPPLPSPATWQDVLRQAFLANGELESAWFEWKAAMARIDQAASWPNSNLAFSYSYMFSSGNMKAWDRSTLGLGFDPSMNLEWPIKTAQAGQVALQDARAAGLRFCALKFDLQRRVLSAYYDLAWAQERLRIQRQNVELLQLLSQSARARVQAGAALPDLLKVQTEYRLAENDLLSLQAQAGSACAMLNGLLGRAPQAPLALRPELPAPRAVPADDAQLIAMGVSQNPELAALAAQVAGRSDALELARLRYIPDITPQVSITGSISQMVGAMVMLPTNMPAIKGAIEESASMLRSAQAASRQTQRDRAAGFVAALYFMRDAERQARLFEQDVLPLAQQAMSSSRQAYTAGSVSYVDLIDSQRTLLNVRLMTAQVRIEREKRLAELEALAGTDIETLAGDPQPAGAPTTMPASQPATMATHDSAASEDKTP